MSENIKGLRSMCARLSHVAAQGEANGWQKEISYFSGKRTYVHALIAAFDEVKAAYLDVIQEIQREGQ